MTSAQLIAYNYGRMVAQRRRQVRADWFPTVVPLNPPLSDEQRQARARLGLREWAAWVREGELELQREWRTWR